MKPLSALIIMAVALILLLASHLHDEAHRFDVVLSAAGSGGSQQDAGSVIATAYLVDYKTGKAWELNGQVRIPVMIAPCPNPLKETERGREPATSK
jgi:hypothetical protein